MRVVVVLVLQLNVTPKPRYWHSITPFCLGPKLTEVCMFGGTPEKWTGSNKTQPKLSETLLLQFGEFTIITYMIQVPI